MTTIQSEAKQIPAIGFRLPLPETTDVADSQAWHENDVRVRPLPAALGFIFKPQDASDSEAFHRNPWDVVEQLEQTPVAPTAELKKIVSKARRLNDCLRDFVDTRVAHAHVSDLMELISTDADLAAAAVQAQLNSYSKQELRLNKQGWC